MSTDRVALVTGAARGQGAAIVSGCTRTVSGSRRAICCVDELTAVGGRAGRRRHRGTARRDGRRPVGHRGARRQSSGSARLTTLVNNAGVLHRASLADETPAGFEGSWRVNCLGPFLGIRAALPHLRAAEGAAIVNTCSTGAIRPFPNHAAYGSSKWALRGLTQVAAAELAASGIRVNAVFPGPVETPMLDEATQARLAAHAALGRIGTADGDRRRRGVPGVRAGVVHHRFGTRRRRRPMPADRMTRQGIFGRNHRRRPGRAGAGNLPEQGRFSRLHHLRPRGRRRRHVADQHLPGPGLRREVAPVLVLVRPERELVAAVVGAAGDPGVLRTLRAALSSSARNLKLNTEITSARWDADSEAWQLTTSAGRAVHLRRRGVGRRPVHPAGASRPSRGGAVHRNADAHGALGSLGRPAGRAGGRPWHRVDRGAAGARGGEGRQEGVLGAALARPGSCRSPTGPTPIGRSGSSPTFRSPRRSTGRGCGCAASRTSR